MPTGRRTAILCVEMKPDPVRLVVDVEPGEPVCGSAAREGEAGVRFEGMLGFLALFERLRPGGRDSSAGAGPGAVPDPARE